MQRVHCDGCSFSEEESTFKSKDSRIQKVNLSIPIDPRFPGGTDTHDADLCPSCLTLLLSTYFRVHKTESLGLGLPTFLDRDVLTKVA